GLPSAGTASDGKLLEGRASLRTMRGLSGRKTTFGGAAGAVASAWEARCLLKRRILATLPLLRLRGLQARERGGTGVAGVVAELLLDAEELVVLGGALSACRGAGLDLAE